MIKQKAKQLLKERPDPNYRHGLSIYLNPGIDFDNLSFDFDKVEIDSGKDVVKIVKVEDKSLEEYFMRLVNFDEDKFTALHAVNLDEVVFVQIPKGVVKSVDLRFSGSFNHFILLAGEDSKCTISVKLEGKGYKSFIAEVFALKDSEVNFVSQQSSEGVNLIVKRSSQKSGCKVNWVDVFRKGEFVRSGNRSFLDGENAEVNCISLFSASKSSKWEINNEAIHNARSTKSNLLTKGITKDFSKVLAKGLVKISKGAENSEGYQKTESLILGGEAYAIPNLEIDNDNVKCSHGSSISYIDDKKLFYLMSRGLTEEEAVDQIVKGFFDSAVDKIPVKIELV